jgi:hypothetical protein
MEHFDAVVAARECGDVVDAFAGRVRRPEHAGVDVGGGNGNARNDRVGGIDDGAADAAALRLCKRGCGKKHDEQQDPGVDHGALLT